MNQARDGGIWILPTPRTALLLFVLSAAVLAGVVIMLTCNDAPPEPPPSAPRSLDR